MLRLSNREEDKSSTPSKTKPEGSGWSLGGPHCFLSLNVITGESGDCGDWMSLRLILGKCVCVLYKCVGSDVLRLCVFFFRVFLWLRLDSHPFNMLKHQCGHSWRPPRQTTSEAGKRERKIWNQGKVDLVSSVVNLCVNRQEGKQIAERKENKGEHDVYQVNRKTH